MDRQPTPEPRQVNRRSFYTAVALMLCLACLVIGAIGLSFVVDIAQEGVAAFLQSIQPAQLR